VSDRVSSGSVSGGDAEPSAARAAVQGLDRSAQAEPGADGGAPAPDGDAAVAPESQDHPSTASTPAGTAAPSGGGDGAAGGGSQGPSAGGSQGPSAGGSPVSLTPGTSGDGRPPMEPFWSQRDWPTITLGPTSLPDGPPPDGPPPDSSSAAGGGADPPPSTHDLRPTAQESEGGPL
ncbi:MAG: hypothetical protein ACRDNK_20325, partial [Solirubrobacteraceae bacterium]